MLKRKIIIIVCCCIILLLVLLPSLGGLYQKYKYKKIEKLEDMQQKNKAYVEWLFLDGEFEVSANKVNVSNLTFNEAKAQIAIYYYNHYSGKNIEYDTLIKEYEVFCKGESNYNNLVEYTTFLNESGMSVFEGDVIKKVSINSYIHQCSKLIMITYGVDVDAQEKDNQLSYDQIMNICKIAAENSKEIYIMGVVENLEMISNVKIPLLYSDFDETDLEVDSQGSRVIKVHDTVGYCSERTDIITGEKKWMVYKVEIAEQDPFFNVCYCCIGDTAEEIKSKMDNFGNGFSLYDEKEEILVYTREFFKITYNFENGCCSKIIVELVE